VATYELEHVEPDDAGIAIVALTGELDLTNAGDLVERIGELANGGTALVLDVNRLVFIDSAAIEQLFQLAHTRGQGATAFVVEPASAVAGTLAIVGLGQAAPVTSSLDEAKALLKRARSA
jgi:anti-anti-sigma factor